MLRAANPSGGSGPGYVRALRQKDAMIDKPDMDRNGRNAGRQTRLRAALRENLKRRKSQSRGRVDQATGTQSDAADHPDQQRSAEDATE